MSLSTNSVIASLVASEVKSKHRTKARILAVAAMQDMYRKNEEQLFAVFARFDSDVVSAALRMLAPSLNVSEENVLNLILALKGEQKEQTSRHAYDLVAYTAAFLLTEDAAKQLVEEVKFLELPTPELTKTQNMLIVMARMVSLRSTQTIARLLRDGVTQRLLEREARRVQKEEEEHAKYFTTYFNVELDKAEYEYEEEEEEAED